MQRVFQIIKFHFLVFNYRCNHRLISRLNVFVVWQFVFSFSSFKNNRFHFNSLKIERKHYLHIHGVKKESMPIRVKLVILNL